MTRVSGAYSFSPDHPFRWAAYRWVPARRVRPARRAVFFGVGSNENRLSVKEIAELLDIGKMPRPRGHMDIEVGVDTTNDRAASFYDGHCHPCSPLVKGWRGRPVKEVTVISALR